MSGEVEPLRISVEIHEVPKVTQMKCGCGGTLVYGIIAYNTFTEDVRPVEVLKIPAFQCIDHDPPFVVLSVETADALDLAIKNALLAEATNRLENC